MPNQLVNKRQGEFCKMKRRIICYIAFILIVAVGLPSMTACSGSGTGLPKGLYPMYEQSSSGAKWGYIDESGEYVIKPQFDSVGEFSEGLAWVYESESELFGYIDESGTWVIYPQFYDAGEFHEGLAAVTDMDSADEENRYGYINTSGEWYIYPKFSYASEFKGNYAVVQQNTGDEWNYGIIKKDNYGEIAVPIKYESVYGYMINDSYLTIDGNFVVVENLDDDERIYVDKNGNEKNVVTNEEALKALWNFDNGPLCMLDEKGELYFVNKKGDIITNDIEDHEYASLFSENRAIVYDTYPKDKSKSEDDNGYSGYLYGYVDENGEMCTEMMFYALDDPYYTDCYFKNGVAFARTLPDENGMISYGYIDKNGEWLVKKEYNMELD